jgi:hypothetical protein
MYFSQEGWLLGGDEFIARIKRLLKRPRNPDEVPWWKRLERSAAEVVRAVAEFYGASAESYSVRSDPRLLDPTTAPAACLVPVSFDDTIENSQQAHDHLWNHAQKWRQFKYPKLTTSTCERPLRFSNSASSFSKTTLTQP